jgi:hypothetical protein
MLVRFRHAFARVVVRLTQRATGLTPINDHRADDIFVVGFPKSGNTWVQYLLAGLLCGVDTTLCSDALLQEIVPDVHEYPSYRRCTQPMFFKSHHLPRPGYRRVIYLLRDGRDAMVSYFHHYNALFPGMDFATLVRTAPGLLSRWHEHVEAWLANPYGAELLVVKYEDLINDPVAQLRRICTFAGIEADESRLIHASEAASFANMKQHEKRLGWDHSTWPKDKSFVRRGTVGSYRDEMPPEVLALFQAEAGATLLKTGYRDQAVDSSPPAAT